MFEQPFNTPYKINIARNYFRNIHTSRLYHLQSLNIQQVMLNLLPNSAKVIIQGQVWDILDAGHCLLLSRGDEVYPLCTLSPNGIGRIVTDFFYDHLDHLEAAYTIPSAPWGSYDVMWTYLGETFLPAFVDLEAGALALTLCHQQRLLEKLLETHSVVYWGSNNSMGAVGNQITTARGLMSIMRPHNHIWVFPEALDNLSPEEICRVKQTASWDQGLSALVGKWMVEDLYRYVVYHYWPGAYIDSDQMGFTLLLPNFNPQHIGTVAFVDYLWRPLSYLVHEKLRYLHQIMFQSDLNDVIGYVRDLESTNHDFDVHRYLSFFIRRPEANTTSSEEQQYLQQLYYHRALRFGSGWGAGIQFRKNRTGVTDALISVIFGFGNWDVGPVEAMAVQLTRPEALESDRVLQDKTQFYELLFSTALC